jgi:hypothetical protein
MNLPDQEGLPVHRLAACFKSTVLTYKYYWFLAILNRLEYGEHEIKKTDLFAEMISHAWFTVNYFRVSFGKQDKIQQAIELLREIEGLTLDADRQAIFKKLSMSNSRETFKTLWHFNSEVPHRFLSPWFPAADQKAAIEASQNFVNDCPYALYKEQIAINPKWVTYLQRNAKMLKGFCYWNLAIYLQCRNPNVPDIPNKLIKSPARKSLTKQRTDFWDIVIRELGGVDCIYTNRKLLANNYAVEHFLPYAFVSHDLIWNLLPADQSFNSSKSDKLPDLDKYFEPFYLLQKQAIDIIQHKAPKNKFLEDYLTLFPTLTALHFNKQKFLEQIQPLVTIASNNGFGILQ